MKGLHFHLALGLQTMSTFLALLFYPHYPKARELRSLRKRETMAQLCQLGMAVMGPPQSRASLWNTLPCAYIT